MPVSNRAPGRAGLVTTLLYDGPLGWMAGDSGLTRRDVGYLDLDPEGLFSLPGRRSEHVLFAISPHGCHSQRQCLALVASVRRYGIVQSITVHVNASGGEVEEARRSTMRDTDCSTLTEVTRRFSHALQGLEELPRFSFPFEIEERLDRVRNALAGQVRELLDLRIADLDAMIADDSAQIPLTDAGQRMVEMLRRRLAKATEENDRLEHKLKVGDAKLRAKVSRIEVELATRDGQIATLIDCLAAQSKTLSLFAKQEEPTIKVEMTPILLALIGTIQSALTTYVAHRAGHESKEPVAETSGAMSSPPEEKTAVPGTANKSELPKRGKSA